MYLAYFGNTCIKKVFVVNIIYKSYSNKLFFKIFRKNVLPIYGLITWLDLKRPNLLETGILIKFNIKNGHEHGVKHEQSNWREFNGIR